MSKWTKRLLILVVLATILAIPSVYAYMFMHVETPDDTFITADIFIDDPIIESVVNKEIDGENVTVKDSIKIKNTGNIESYIRIKFITHWEDSKGNIVGRASEELTFTPSNDWVYDSTNDVYYYKYPIMPGDTTNEFLATDSEIVLKHIKDDVEYGSIVVTYDYYQVVEIHVEGIQANPSKVVEEIWGVTLTDRNITSVNK